MKAPKPAASKAGEIQKPVEGALLETLPPQFEFETLLKARNSDDLVDQMNALGLQGWQAFAVVDAGEHRGDALIQIFFRREIRQ